MTRTKHTWNYRYMLSGQQFIKRDHKTRRFLKHYIATLGRWRTAVNLEPQILQVDTEIRALISAIETSPEGMKDPNGGRIEPTNTAYNTVRAITDPMFELLSDLQVSYDRIRSNSLPTNPKKPVTFDHGLQMFVRKERVADREPRPRTRNVVMDERAFATVNDDWMTFTGNVADNTAGGY